MTYDLFSGLVAFAFVTSITPGPNNMMLMSSGANFGFMRSIPHMLGIALGFTLMVALVGLGLMRVFDFIPYSYDILKIVSAIYLLWLAWKFANAGRPQTATHSPTPMTFLQAAAFQWANPKAWSMALGAITLFAPDRTTVSVLLVALVFGAVNLPSVSSWTILGQQMQRFLTNNRRLMIFNWTMAALLVLSMIPSLRA